MIVRSAKPVGIRQPVLRLALAQINPIVGDFFFNERMIGDALLAARRSDAKLVVFPEMTITGYPPEDLLHHPSFIRENRRSLERVARKVKRETVVVGFVDSDRKSGRLYNAAAVLHRGRICGVYRKHALPNYGVFDEKRYFAQGNKALIIRDGDFAVGLTICEDIWDKKSFVYQPEYRRAVSALLNLSASPFHAGKQSDRKTLVSRLAQQLRAPAIYLNLVGGQDELVFDGGSFVVDGRGNLLAEASRFQEQVLTVEVPIMRCIKRLKHASTARVSGLISRSFDQQPPWRAQTLSVEEEIYSALVSGTRDYVEKNGFGRVVLGISGGIDSALVASIAVDALGPDRVLGVTMPSIYTSKGTYSDAKALANQLRIRLLELNIQPIFRSYQATLANLFKGLKADVTEENLQARIRGNLLMALSNKLGCLTLTTGNKSEMATGYCTLYGDMAGGFAVIKDVPKTMVFRLAKWRNLCAGHALIPVSIIRRPPSAELRHGQKDQDSLPPYSLLDQLILRYVEQLNPGPTQRLRLRGLSRVMMRRVMRMIDLSEYKRRQAPPGVKITPRAFGRDRRMPITNHYQSWAHQ